MEFPARESSAAVGEGEHPEEWEEIVTVAFTSALVATDSQAGIPGKWRQASPGPRGKRRTGASGVLHCRPPRAGEKERRLKPDLPVVGSGRGALVAVAHRESEEL
jgi:hypothetical protein